MKTTVLTLSVALLALAGCTGDDDKTSAADSDSKPNSSASASPAPKFSCKDDTGDSKGVLDLTAASFDDASGNVVTTYSWKGALPEKGSIVWTTTVKGKDGTASRQLVYSINNDRVAGHYVLDPATKKQVKLDAKWAASVGKNGDELEATFPKAALAPLGSDYDLSYVVNVSNKDIDDCKGDGS